VYELCCAYVFSSCILPTENKTVAVSERKQAHVNCTALGDTPIEKMWKMSCKQIGEDTDQSFSFIIYIGLQHLYRFESCSDFKERILVKRKSWK
jgi:hypothetical protein